MRSVIVLVCVCVGLAVSARADSEKIPLVGLDAQGLPVQSFVPKELYQEKLGEVVATVQDSTLPVIRKKAPHWGWSLRTITVGLGMDIGVGLSGILKLDILPHFRALFSNSKEPALP